MKKYQICLTVEVESDNNISDVTNEVISKIPYRYIDTYSYAEEVSSENKNIEVLMGDDVEKFMDDLINSRTVFWHDLVKYPNDLPMNTVLNEFGEKVFYDKGVWRSDDANQYITDTPSKWCEAPTFTKDELKEFYIKYRDKVVSTTNVISKFLTLMKKE